MSACRVRMFEVFAQFARRRAFSVAFCNLRNKSSLVMPNCAFAWSGDKDAAAAMHTDSIKAVQEFWLTLPTSTFIQNRSNTRWNDGICSTCASGLTASSYLWYSASASTLLGSCGGSRSLLCVNGVEDPKSRVSAGEREGMCSADKSADD